MGSPSETARWKRCVPRDPPDICVTFNNIKSLMTTPLRRQYLEIKRRYPGMILFFQIGDFYETFDEDAHVVARELGLALTRKYFGKGQVHPLAGVPVQIGRAHVARLINRGYK